MSRCSQSRARQKFLDVTWKHNLSRGKTEKLDFSETENLLFCECSCKEDETQAMNWEKTFENHIYNKGLESRVYKLLPKFNSRKLNRLIRK